MIFKQIDSPVDKTRKTLALFNKDWNTYKTNWQNANGVFGKIGSIFSSSKGTSNNIVSNEQLQILRNWNNAVKHGCTNQETFNKIIANADNNTKMYFAGLNKGKGSINGLKNAQNAAETSTIGLTIAQTALNAVISMGTGLLVSLVVKGIDKLIHANEEAIEKAEELRRKYEEFKSTNESNVTTLKGLEEEFKELSKGVSQYGDNVSLTTEQYERYKKIIQQIVGISPSVAEGYSTENGYIADKNGLLERAIELQEQEYHNELRKITNLDNLKTSMSGYIAEYKEAFGGGLVTDDMSAISTTTATDFSNALYDAFNLTGSRKHNYDNTEKVARKVIESLGIEDVNSEIQKYINKSGVFESSWFFKAYADTIAENIEVITNSLSADDVGLDDTIFDQNIEKLDSAAQSYLDMKDAISMANESIQRDLGYIAEYADGYSDLSTEQQKFVNEFLKGYSIPDIMSESNNPFDQGWKFDENKMASVKSQIIKFVKTLSQDETTKTALADLYAIPTDEQSIGEFIDQFRNALEVVQKYCEENGIEIPIAISDSEQTINDLEAQYQRTVDFAKDKFDGYDPTAFFKEHSINTQEEIDTWQKIAQAVRNATEAEKEYLQSSALNEKNISLPVSKTISDLKDLNTELDNLGNAMANLDSEGRFDLGNLDSIADYFLGLEGVSHDAEAVNNALKSLGDQNSTLEEQADAVNTLADQYLTTSKILDHLNEENAKLMKFQLERMGISNAEDIVDAALNKTLLSQAEIESILAQYKSIVTGQTLALNNVTAQEIQNLFEERIITEETAAQMAVMAIKKQLVNGNTLDTTADINNLIELCKTLGGTTTALDLYNRVRKVASLAGLPSDATESLRKQAEQELQNAIKTGEKSINAVYSGIPKAVYNGGSAVADLLKDTGNAAEQAKDTYEELFDFFEKRVDVLNNALELLNANLENVVGSNAKNLLIDAEIGINKESVNNYTDALAMYQSKATEALAKIPEDLQQKIVDGAVSMTDFIGSGSEDIVNAIKDYQKWSDKVSDCQQELAKLKETIRQLELDKFNNIIEDFTNQFDISTNAQDLINKQIDLFEEAGELIGKGFYEGLIKESQGQLNILEQEKQALVNELNAGLDTGLIEVGTDEWLEMVSALNDVDGSILDCKKDIEEFNNSIQELHWDIIKRIQDNFSDLSDEISNLIGLISDIDVSDKKGTWSLEGLAQLGLYAQEYERAIYTAQMYADEIEKLNQAYMEGRYSATEYADKLSELKKAQWNEINIT